MNRPFLACAFFTLASAALAAQQANPYQGTSNPPADDVIVTTSTPRPKPPAGKLMVAAPSVSVQIQAQAPAQPKPQPQSQPSSVDPSANDPDAAPAAPPPEDPNPAPAPQVQVQASAPPAQAACPAQPPAPVLQARAPAEDPDGDIVHPAPLGPGQLADGTSIRVKLLDRLSTWDSEKGQPFHSQVAADVLQGGQVVIPAGTEIDGTIVEASSGHFGGHGSMRLRPEVVIFPDGSQFRLHALVTGTPGSRTRLGSEGTILPGSRVKRSVPHPCDFFLSQGWEPIPG
jgi:hypothetical protein